jgi:hypothetical protein
MDRRSLVPRGANGALKLERIPRSGVVLTRSRGHVRSKQRGSVRLLCAPPPFELCWRQHPDRAVQPPAVVEGLDELEDRRASDSSRRERVTVRELAFDRCEQALGRGVLKRRPNGTHRRGDPRLSEPPGERQRDVLRSLIRVMYESRRRSSARGRHLERSTTSRARGPDERPQPWTPAGLVLPPNVDSFPEPSGPSSQVSTRTGSRPPIQPDYMRACAQGDPVEVKGSGRARRSYRPV